LNKVLKFLVTIGNLPVLVKGAPGNSLHNLREKLAREALNEKVKGKR
jgi:hypothetical protein